MHRHSIWNCTHTHTHTHLGWWELTEYMHFYTVEQTALQASVWTLQPTAVIYHYFIHMFIILFFLMWLVIVFILSLLFIKLCCPILFLSCLMFLSVLCAAAVWETPNEISLYTYINKVCNVTMFYFVLFCFVLFFFCFYSKTNKKKTIVLTCYSHRHAKLCL